MRRTFIAFIFFLTLAGFISAQQRAENYLSFSKDGAWCWFSDPRAVFHNGMTYAGWTSSTGDVTVATYNITTGKIKSTIVYPKFQADDHTAPSLLFLPDGRLMLFFTRHNGGFYYTTSFKPEDISDFEEVKHIDMGRMQCYSNPVMLSEENNRIYVYFRGGKDWKPSYVFSDDLGKTWSASQAFVAKPGASIYNRPYTKVISDGKASVHFAFTDGHPRDEAYNSIYYLKYEHGKFYDAAGNLMGDTTSLPIDQNKVPKVYDGTKTLVRSWIWDIALDKNENPVLVYATFPEESKHIYNYAGWDGQSWQNHKVCDAGSWFPRFEKKKEAREPEPHYSGGIILDHTNPDRVYLSRPHNDIFEIEQWKTNNGGKTWDSHMLTENSDHDNVRPFVVRNTTEGQNARVLWMHVLNYRHYTHYFTEIKANISGPGFSGEIKKEPVLKVMKAVADWQIENFDRVKHHPLDWTNGALYTGMYAWSVLADSNKYQKWLLKIGTKYQWQPGFRMYHADDYVVLQTWLDQYRELKNERMLDPSIARIDWIIEHPSKSSLKLSEKGPHDRWWWCDALFMAPPVYTRLTSITGDKKYVKFMHKEYQATYDYLYDKEEHLFYRDDRYFDKREANGKKVFWGRGNGWVMGGLVSILKELPEKSKYRPFYEELFKEMMTKAASLQDKNGYWHASLLDPESYPNPETSSSGFITYALAYGVNSGLLDRGKYLPVVEKGWKALVRAVYPDGKLGWVQPIGADPKKVKKDMTEVYGVGAFLLAGSEVVKLTE